MITYTKGNIFDAKKLREDGYLILVNPVNIGGVMGAGLAKQFKDRYPDMFKKYKEMCYKGELEIGQPTVIHVSGCGVMLFPTKRHWSEPSELEFIEEGLAQIAHDYAGNPMNTFAFPKIGCGLGGLDWKDVKPMIENYLDGQDVVIYE